MDGLVNAKLVQVTPILLWFMVDISKYYSVMVFVHQRSTTSRLGTARRIDIGLVQGDDHLLM